MIQTNGNFPSDDPDLIMLIFSFDSFAPVRSGRAKWFVDGCDYMACVADAINKVDTTHVLCLLLNLSIY